MVEISNLTAWATEHLHALVETFSRESLYLLLLLPLVLAVLSRNLLAFSGAFAMTILTLSASLGWEQQKETILFLLGLGASLFAIAGFAQRRLVKRVATLERQHAEMQDRFSQQQERELLKSVRGPSAEIVRAHPDEQLSAAQSGPALPHPHVGR
jgi:hypothetical protein